MTVVDLRMATLEDAEAIARIHVETWRSSYAGMLPHDHTPHTRTVPLSTRTDQSRTRGAA